MKKVLALTAAMMLLCMVGGPAFAGWTVVNLHPSGATHSYAHGVSGGLQVGYAGIGGNDHAGLWSGTAASWVDLNPAGATYSYAKGVSGGRQVGIAEVGGNRHACLWSGSAGSWVDLNPAGAVDSWAVGVSNGQQVGEADLGGVYHASLWSGTAGTWVDLNPAGTTWSEAYGISGGQQVGSADSHAGLWSGTAGSWVDLNPVGAADSYAWGVSGGQQVGDANFGSTWNPHACLWSGTAESWVDLNPAEAVWSSAYGVSGGQQVGYAEVGGNRHACLWSGTAESWVDLHALLPAGAYSSSVARSVDVSAGEIWVAGSAYNISTGRDEAMLWHFTPDGPTIPAAKLLANDLPVTLTAKTVTYATPDFFYIEEDSRCMGIRVEKVGHGLAVGMKADVAGAMKTNLSRERYILASSATQTPAPNGNGVVRPVGMNNNALGGRDWFVSGTGGQCGTTGSGALNNIGLLVKTCGRFQMIDATTFTLDDGSGLLVKCTVPAGTVLNAGWAYVVVTGVSSIYEFDSATYPPNLLVRDIQVPQPHAGEMIYIPAGSFLMGNSGVGDDATYSNFLQELPQHSVYVSGYWIGKYEVTRGEYLQFMQAGGYSDPAYWSSAGWSWKVSNGRTEPGYWAAQQDWFPGGGQPFTQTAIHPVVGVTYYEAEAFCNWAGGHLPTEAQWEKAARWTGNHSNVYPWGDTCDAEKCNNWDDTNPAGGGYGMQTAPVGSYPSGASPYGLQDMAGNVWEWGKDWYSDHYYSQTPTGGWVDPQGPMSGSHRVARGGSWYDHSVYARCALRADGDPYGQGAEGRLGFRLVR